MNNALWLNESLILLSFCDYVLNACFWRRDLYSLLVWEISLAVRFIYYVMSPALRSGVFIINYYFSELLITLLQKVMETRAYLTASRSDPPLLRIILRDIAQVWRVLFSAWLLPASPAFLFITCFLSVYILASSPPSISFSKLFLEIFKSSTCNNSIDCFGLPFTICTFLYTSQITFWCFLFLLKGFILPNIWEVQDFAKDRN